VNAQSPVLTVDSLNVAFPGRGFRATPTRVLHDVSITLGEGETLGLVGESGSGKTTLGRAILGLAPMESGTVTLAGQDITHVRAAGRKKVAADLQVIFQDPYGSLNPSMTVRDIIVEPLLQAGVRAAEADARVRTLLDQVRLPADSGRRYASEFSGGQRQRIAIARALIRRPKVIVCDEVVSALDLSTQATIVQLLVDIQQETGVSYLFTSHDLSVIRAISHRVAVLFRGRMVEMGEARQVIGSPENEYTQRLLMAAPVVDPAAQRIRRQQYRERFAGLATAPQAS
jgi:peptide/nickel transport system ATP-binding protein